MAALNFPTSPIDGQEYTENGNTFKWSAATSSWHGVKPIGYTGSQGSGFTGSASTVIGFTGSKGDIGFTGSRSEVIGFTGSRSEVIGFTGSKGDIGFTGSRSEVIGFTGSRSEVIGFTGSKGDIGFTGSAGAGSAFTVLAASDVTHYPLMATGTGTLTANANVMAGVFQWTNSTGLQTRSLGVGTAASTTNGEIRATDNITAYFSDERLKDLLGTIPDALNKVQQLNGYYYRHNSLARELGYSDNSRHVGVSAQEVASVMPEVVTRAPIDIAINDNGDEYSLTGQDLQTVYYEKLIPLLIEAIKELADKVAHLESQNLRD